VWQGSEYNIAFLGNQINVQTAACPVEYSFEVRVYGRHRLICKALRNQMDQLNLRMDIKQSYQFYSGIACSAQNACFNQCIDLLLTPNGRAGNKDNPILIVIIIQYNV